MRLPHLIPTILWCVPLALQAAIAVVMVLRGLVRIFPFFFAYSVLVSSRDVILFLLQFFSGSQTQLLNEYALVFWWGDAIAILLSLGVVFETLRHLFRPYPSLRFIFTWIWIVAAIAATGA